MDPLSGGWVNSINKTLKKTKKKQKKKGAENNVKEKKILRESFYHLQLA